MNGIIDNAEGLEAIKRKFGKEYYRTAKAHYAAAQLWDIECNEHGVASARKEIALLPKGSYRAEISLARTNQGAYLIGLNASTTTGGFGYAPSVWNRYGYLDELSARRSGIEKLMAYFTKHGEKSNSEIIKANIRRVISTLEEHKTPQMELFF